MLNVCVKNWYRISPDELACESYIRLKRAHKSSCILLKLLTMENFSKKTFYTTLKLRSANGLLGRVWRVCKVTPRNSLQVHLKIKEIKLELMSSEKQSANHGKKLPFWKCEFVTKILKVILQLWLGKLFGNSWTCWEFETLKKFAL